MSEAIVTSIADGYLDWSMHSAHDKQIPFGTGSMLGIEFAKRGSKTVEVALYIWLNARHHKNAVGEQNAAILGRWATLMMDNMKLLHNFILKLSRFVLFYILRMLQKVESFCDWSNFFLCSASLQDITSRFKERKYGGLWQWSEFPNKIAVQSNDTHPTLAIPELTRLLMNDEGLG